MTEKEKERLRQWLHRASLILASLLLILWSTSPSRLRQLKVDSGFGGGFEEGLSIHVLDVGKADAILLTCDGHTAVLDAGTILDGSAVVDYILRNDLASPEYMIASHPDSDHIGGMPQVLRELGARQFIRSAYFPEAYGLIDPILEDATIPIRTVEPGDSFRLADAVLTVLAPVQEYLETNSASLVLRLEYEDFTALFCGDIEADAEQDLLESGAALSANFLKVAHHGSRTSSTEAFLQAVSPQYAIVSVGKDNNRLPNEDALRRLDGICPYVFRTDTDGTVVFSYQDGQMTIRTEA